MMMFLSGVESNSKRVSSSSKTYYYAKEESKEEIPESALIVCVVSGLISFGLALIVFWNEQFDVAKEFNTDDYYVWRYIHVGRRLAGAAIWIILIGIVISILVANDVFHPLFFSENYLKKFQ